MFLFIRKSITNHQGRKLFHDSSFKRDPVVKPANARTGLAIRKRINLRAEPKVQHSPAKTYEPFPYAINENNRIDVMKQLTTPLASIPYDEQLASKESHCRNSLRYFAQQLYKTSTPIRVNVNRLPCHVNTIIRSPTLESYRNKDEFSIWRGYDGKTNTVGFMAFPVSKHGDTVCLEPDGSSVLKPESQALAKILQEFIRQHAKLGVSYDLGQDGGWRRFILRSNLDSDLMLIGVVNPRTLKVGEIVKERENFKNFILKRSVEVGLNVKSLYFQPCPHNSCSGEIIPFELLHGDRTITERINEFKFNVSPESYLHQNTKALEILYSTIKQNLKHCFSLTPDSKDKPLLLSVNSGLGATAILLSSLASQVLGIDRNLSSVDEAKSNAILNNTSNVEFINANLEIVLEKVLEKYSSQIKDSIVICHPSRIGLHPHVINAIRNNGRVSKVVYVSPRINDDRTIDNLVELCRKLPGKGPPPFVPIMASPVDMYPHTEFYETVLILERISH